MNIILPQRIDSSEQLTINSKSIIVIGANGSGKTRFGSKIEKNHNKNTHRISAQKSLSMPKDIGRTTTIEKATQALLYGREDYNENLKDNSRWNSNPNTSLLNDIDKLLILLFTDQFEESVKFREAYIPGQSIEKSLTRLERIRNIWEDLLPHRKLNIRANCIETFPTGYEDRKYNASEMSDGERVLFYLIGEAVSVPKDSIIIIDEPELHLHKSIIKKLWDKIENERPDCTFIYLTHDIDFASSRQDSTKIWVKSYDGSRWDYKILDSNSDLPEQLYLEILGSRDSILFIEGDESSTDYKLLQLVFSDYTVKPLGGCEKVFDTTKALNDQKAFHNIKTFGLIDRDRRTEEEIAHIKNPDIWVAGVAEIENFLLIEEVVKTVAKKMMKDPDLVFDKVKANVIGFFNSEMYTQATEHTVSRIERIFNNATNNSKVKSYEDLKIYMDSFFKEQDFGKIYTEIVDSFKLLIEANNYDGILKVFNNKGLRYASKVMELCDLNTRNDAYLSFIIGILKQNDDDSKTIKDGIRKRIAM